MRSGALVVIVMALAGCGPAEFERAQRDRDLAYALWHQCASDPNCPPDELTKLKHQVDFASAALPHGIASPLPGIKYGQETK